MITENTNVLRFFNRFLYSVGPCCSYPDSSEESSEDSSEELLSGVGGCHVVPSTQAQDSTGLPAVSLQFASKSAWLVYTSLSLHVQLCMFSGFWQGVSHRNPSRLKSPTPEESGCLGIFLEIPSERNSAFGQITPH